MGSSIYPILLTYNNKLVHSATGLTPKEARDPSNELEADVNMQLQATRNIKYPELKVGDTVYIYMKRKRTKKLYISLWSDVALEAQEISHSQGQQ